MQDWFSEISKSCELPTTILQKLDDKGFVVIPGVIASADLSQLAAKYDSAVAAALADDVKIGSTTTRVNDFVNRGRVEFDAIYIYPPLLEASFRVIGQAFKLSSMHARTLHSHSRAQKLHIDFKSDEERFSMVGFILMIDDFLKDNGATRFVPGSQRWSSDPDKLTSEALAEYESQTQITCGQAGSMIVFNGSVWHGHAANTTDTTRRSIQGAFIPRDAQAGTDFRSRMRAETFARISPLAKYLLAI